MNVHSLSRLLKSLAHPNRLMLIGLLDQGEFSAEELAELLSLHPATISHHLSQLTTVGLVRVRVDGHYRAFSLDHDRVRQLAEYLADSNSFFELAQQAGLKAYEQNSWQDFVHTPLSNRTLPGGAGNQRIIFHRIARSLKRDRKYTITELNGILGQFHQDPDALTRQLIDHGFLKFQAGGYVVITGPESESASGLGIWD